MIGLASTGAIAGSGVMAYLASNPAITMKIARGSAILLGGVIGVVMGLLFGYIFESRREKREKKEENRPPPAVKK